MSARAQSVAEDKFGNIYFVEETDQKAPLPGVLMIPAGTTGLTTDAGLARVDPNLPAVTGVTTDAAGNLLSVTRRRVSSSSPTLQELRRPLRLLSGRLCPPTAKSVSI